MTIARSSAVQANLKRTGLRSFFRVIREMISKGDVIGKSVSEMQADLHQEGRGAWSVDPTRCRVI